MLELHMEFGEFYNEATGEFESADFDHTMLLEHSLYTISKWEAITHKAYLDNVDRSKEEVLLYIECMLVDKSKKSLMENLTTKDIEQIQKYISDPSTATTFSNFKKQNAAKHHVTTSEEIYYGMFKRGIPLECEHWHLNRLLTLMHVFDVKDTDQKMSKRDRANWQKQLNASRRAKMNSKG